MKIGLIALTLCLVSCSMDYKTKEEQKKPPSFTKEDCKYVVKKISDLKIPKPKACPKPKVVTEYKERKCPIKKEKCRLIGFTVMDELGEPLRMVGCRHKVNKVNLKDIYEAIEILAN